MNTIAGRSCPLIPIGLPHDGESRYGLSYAAAIAWLKELKSIGYNVPDYAISEIELDEKRAER